MKIFFVQFFCVFLPPPLNIFCFCSVHTISLLYRAHLCMKCSLDISNFLEEISSLSHSVVFLYFFVLITEEGFLNKTWLGFFCFVSMMMDSSSKYSEAFSCCTVRWYNSCSLASIIDSSTCLMNDQGKWYVPSRTNPSLRSSLNWLLFLCWTTISNYCQGSFGKVIFEIISKANYTLT